MEALRRIKTREDEIEQLEKAIRNLESDLKLRKEKKRIGAIKKLEWLFGDGFEELLDVDKLCKLLHSVATGVETDGNRVIALIKGTMFYSQNETNV